jgi:hypothetical protein
MGYTGVMVAWYGSILSRFENVDVLCRFLYYLEELFPRIVSPLLLQKSSKITIPNKMVPFSKQPYIYWGHGSLASMDLF